MASTRVHWKQGKVPVEVLGWGSGFSPLNGVSSNAVGIAYGASGAGCWIKIGLTTFRSLIEGQILIATGMQIGSGGGG